MCLCSKSTTVLLEGTIPKTMDVQLLHFYCIRNKYIVQKCTYTVHTVHIYTTGEVVNRLTP